MENYHRQIILTASSAAVYQAIATQDGLRSWWTANCDVASEVGGRATFRFGQCYKVMQITSLLPEREVRWHCLEAFIDAPGLQRTDEWIGTDIVFQLTQLEDGTTRLDFEHRGLTPDISCFTICRDGWNHFLASLQSLVESGQGNPFHPAVKA